MAQLDATGADIYLVAAATSTTTKAACTTAIASGKRLIKTTTLGDIGGTRAVTEKKYLSPDDSEKVLGSISYGNIAVEMPFNATDTAGQAEMRTIFGDRTERKAIIKETDGNFTVFPVKCSAFFKAYAIDEFVMFKGTLEQNGAYTDITA
jgi:hypothetical protein